MRDGGGGGFGASHQPFKPVEIVVHARRDAIELIIARHYRQPGSQIALRDPEKGLIHVTEPGKRCPACPQPKHQCYARQHSAKERQPDDQPPPRGVDEPCVAANDQCHLREFLDVENIAPGNFATGHFFDFAVRHTHEIRHAGNRPRQGDAVFIEKADHVFGWADGSFHVPKRVQQARLAIALIDVLQEQAFGSWSGLPARS